MPQSGRENILTSQSTSRSHPRRPPAHKSVSLLHQPKGRPHHDPTAIDAKAPRAKSSEPLYAKKHTSSGESSNADRWFEASNHNIRPSTDALVEDEPPFFLRNSSSSATPPDAQHGSKSLLYPDNVLRMRNVDSGSEDFRSVIDDLTIENKKLKRRLRRYEKYNDAHLQSDKMFEVRVHGLPPDKKRELDATLRTFALSLHTTSQTSVSGNGSNNYVSQLGQQQSTSSLTSTRLEDSAYASMSGNNTLPTSGKDKASRKVHNQGMSTQNIQSYLHEIPAGLLPRQPTAMSEKTRRKLVVRRLEQLFVGKGATRDGHQQPMQQEEVAQSAARADRKLAGGQHAVPEGAREARIVPANNKDPGAVIKGSMQGHESTVAAEKGNNNSGSDSPGQRPTRPLDLDPYRAQVPADNIQYMRHLGFSPPDIGASPGLADDHGWVYLNVLTNMAQLHDINVTPAFVKKAVAEHSKRLELSHDGRKARWKGGSSLTRNSSDGSLVQSPSGSPEHPSKLDGASQNMDKSKVSADTDAAKGYFGKLDKLAYTPLFAHREDSSEESSSEMNMSGWSSPVAEDTPGESSSRSQHPRKRKEDSGAIIFYNNANFCTDLSGDGGTRVGNSSNAIAHSKTLLRTIGLSGKSIPDAQLRGIAEPKGPLSFPATVATDSMDIDPQSSSDGDVLMDCSKPPSFKETSSEDSNDPVEFEVSGLGGVQPTDNFSISVKTRQRMSFSDTNAVAAEHRSRIYPTHIRKLLAEKRIGASRPPPARAFNAEQISSSCKNLPASELPPASFFPIFNAPDDEDFEDSDEDNETSLSDGLTDRNQTLPAGAPQLMHWQTHDSLSDESSETEDEAEDDESDGSIDMLAHARLADPVTVRAQEREYDGNIADRLREEIPAGSSAATAGGGSGFNSPIVLQSSSKRPDIAPPLKRARLSSEVVDDKVVKSPKLV